MSERHRAAVGKFEIEETPGMADLDAARMSHASKMVARLDQDRSALSLH